jgi:hypothetical protein
MTALSYARRIAPTVLTFAMMVLILGFATVGLAA